MQVLFVVRDYYPDGNANANILVRLAKFIQAAGDQVVVAKLAPLASIGSETLQDGIRVLTIPTDRTGWGGRALLAFRQRRFLSALVRAVAYSTTRLLGQFIDVNRLQPQHVLGNGKLSRVARDCSADVVITTSNPFWIHGYGRALKRSSHATWTVYILDSYYANPTGDLSSASRRRRLREEAGVLRSADRAIVTPDIYADYSESRLRKYLHKVTPLELPMVRDLTHISDQQVALNTDYINCSFIGHLYPNLRDPAFLLETFRRIRIRKLRLNIIGKTIGDFPTGYIEELVGPLEDRIVFIPPVDGETAVAYMQKSNVLINLGNKESRMFPSKFLDYCSTGRPIINFHWSSQCPTLPYAKRYRLCLNVAVDEESVVSAAERIEDFIIENASSRMTYEEVVSCLGARSSDEIASAFSNILRSGR